MSPTSALPLPRRWRPRNHIGGATGRAGLILLAAALVALFAIANPNFIGAGNISTTLVNVSGTLVAAIAMARLLIAGQIDLSIGGMMALVAVSGAWVMRATDDFVIGAVATLAFGLLLGLLNGVLVRVLKISPIIVTLALLGVYSGLAFVITQSRPIFELPQEIELVGRLRIAGVPVVVIVALIVFVAGALALTKTVGGVRSYAIGGDARAASALGIDVPRHLTWLYVYMGGSVGLVALLTFGRLGSASPNLGVGLEIAVITAVILGGVGFAGGTGRPLGVFFGVITIGILNAGLIFVGISDYWQTVIGGSVLLLALGVDQLNEYRRSRSRRAGRARIDGSRDDGLVEPAALQAHVDPGAVALRATELRKSYGAVTAVSDVSLALRAGQVTCLLGDNGAGKSTVIKMLSGLVRPDGGRIELDGHGSIEALDSLELRELGVETVYQDLAVAPNLGAAYNLTLGREPRRFGFGSLAVFDRQAAIEQARARLESLGIVLDDYLAPVASLSGGQRQCVAIARSDVADVKVVILDEPTAALGVRQKALVLRLARTLADRGAAVLMITHDVESVGLIADRVIVLNLGRVSFDDDADQVTSRDLIHLMAGLELESTAKARNAEA
ncbi:ATP-binding cassette domain-containing protein [Microcella daejeonensis]|uniref:ATP-binding cassette domain-containing protein n=1 Tax=Microcella daejeonensis TaxID=2994971 RepID=UPI00226DC39F|nr:ATP-binding cassette domain-containing protein [Microcella daejeonensis]WAB82926.1 ATP-binding cassette domain-containing protein [Microcella daejeonensis]